MTKTKRTQVSKANPGIKAILSRTVGAEWTGRKVTVLEVAPEWTHTQYVDDNTVAFAVCLDDMSAARIPGPVYGSSVETVPHSAHEGVAIVLWMRGHYGGNTVEIIIPAGEDYHGAIDAAALAVLVDAMIDGRKTRKALEDLVALTSAHVGMRGIATALAAARVKELRKGEANACQEAA
jgi:hypothetical protein